MQSFKKYGSTMLEANIITKLFNFKSTERFDVDSLIAFLSNKFEKFHYSIVENFGPNGFYILILFAFFIFLIITIYIKSVIDTFHTAQKLADNNSFENDGLFYTYENQPDADYDTDDTYIDNQHAKNAFAKLQSDEELSKNIIEASVTSADFLNISTEYNALKAKMQRHAKQKKEQLQQWQNDHSEELAVLNEEQRKKRELHNLIAMILNLLGRGVSQNKIAQAIFFNNQEKYSEFEIIQLIQTLRDFIGLCNAEHFEVLPNRESLPSNQEALYALAYGNTTPCLTLLQSYLNLLMQQSNNESDMFKDMTYAKAAAIACIMGNIARLTDLELAHNSFELATELSPNSTNAWINLADIYLMKGANEKAMIAYQSVLELGDSLMYDWQIADAREKLSEYYEKQGMLAKAEEFYKNNLDFYKNCGIRTPLTNLENTSYDIIYKTKDRNLNVSLAHLLVNENQ